MSRFEGIGQRAEGRGNRDEGRIGARASDFALIKKVVIEWLKHRSVINVLIAARL